MAAPHRIDVHHHVTPPSLRTEKMRAGAGGGPTYAWTLEKTLEDMEKGDVRGVVISMPYPIDIWPNPKDTRGITREWNDYAASLVRDHPGRFGQFTMLPILDIEGSLREIEYSYDVLKADGINLMTSIGDKWLGDPYYDPIFAELDRRKAVVYTHPAVPDCTAGVLPEIRDAVIEFGTDTTRAITRLLFSGAAHRYPNIRWIWSHAGGTAPFLTERLVRFAQNEKGMKERVPEGVLAYLKRFYYDTAQAAHPWALASLMRLVAITQVVFGTDFPWRTAAETARQLKEYGFSAEELRAIDSVNIEKLLPRWGR
jgi:predicted TIM-barrel fold metal-dependent hydrolase